MNRQSGSVSLLRESTRARLIETGRRVAFWSSVLLPVAYLPALFTLAGRTKGVLFGLLLLVHVGCLVVGHGYTRAE